jgi:hypothetical protein
VPNRRATNAIGVLAAGMLLTQQACTSVDQQSNGPIGFVSPSAANQPSTVSQESSAPGKATDPILAGRRKIVIKPIPSFEEIVAVDTKGRLTLTDGEAEHGLFVLTPVGDKYQIKTAQPEPSCLGIKTNGSKALTVVAAACDPGRAGQLFTLSRQKDQNGDPTYAISSQNAFLQVFERSGLIAEELGDAPLKTTFALVDNGPYSA